ncbi:MAG: LPXTG cell wall anchor domain-containing protein [Cryomorphaceae bacterium]|nr:LPXTG cell wall anchor domain-containing protein [Flavobacteriales bacterium]
MKSTSSTLLLIAYVATAGTLGAQTPTHVDQGTTDDTVHLTDDLSYLFLIVALLVLMAGWFLLLRKRKRNRRK